METRACAHLCQMSYVDARSVGVASRSVRGALTLWTRAVLVMLVMCLTTSMTDAKGLTYVVDASFEPSAVGAVLMPNAFPVRIECTPPCFNPSVVPLPPAVRVATSRGHAKYVSTFRSTPEEALCGVLQKGSRRLGMKTYMFLLDCNYQKVVPVVLADGHVENFGMHDVRLERFGDRILLHGMYYKGQSATWILRWLVLNPNATTGRVTSSTAAVVHGDVKQSYLKNGPGKNYGILWSGRNGDPFNILYWLGPRLDVRRGLPPPPSQNTSIKRLMLHGRPAHNNGSPVALGTVCPGHVLAIGHVHLDSSLPAHVRGQKGATYHGNTYINYWFVARDTEPYDIVATSPAFCLPSLNNATLCETIQFIVTVAKVTETTLLVSYGVNDCEAAVVELEIRSVLAFAMSMNRSSSTRRLKSMCGSPALRSRLG